MRRHARGRAEVSHRAGGNVTRAERKARRVQKHVLKAVGKAIRVPVDYRFDAINPDFELMLAKIGAYADEKYGDCFQYTATELTGNRSPLNHARAHINSYMRGESYDRFDGDPEWHLVAAAYNLQMAFYYSRKFGRRPHPLRVPRAVPKRR